MTGTFVLVEDLGMKSLLDAADSPIVASLVIMVTISFLRR
jgi:hypothetical protein